MKNNDKTAWSYLAGLLDGEGCFTITGIWKRNKEGSKPYFHMNLIISLYNTNLDVMHWLIEHFGGTYYVHHPSKKPTHKTGYSWHPKGAKNKELLILGTLPYLVIKRKQALLSLEYLRLDRVNPEKRKEIREQVQTLNGHGNGKRQTTNTFAPPEKEDTEEMIESDLIGDYESAPLVTADA